MDSNVGDIVNHPGDDTTTDNPNNPSNPKTPRDDDNEETPDTGLE